MKGGPLLKSAIHIELSNGLKGKLSFMIGKKINKVIVSLSSQLYLTKSVRFASMVLLRIGNNAVQSSDFHLYQERHCSILESSFNYFLHEYSYYM